MYWCVLLWLEEYCGGIFFFIYIVIVLRHTPALLKIKYHLYFRYTGACSRHLMLPECTKWFLLYISLCRALEFTYTLPWNMHSGIYYCACPWAKYNLKKNTHTQNRVIFLNFILLYKKQFQILSLNFVRNEYDKKEKPRVYRFPAHGFQMKYFRSNQILSRGPYTILFLFFVSWYTMDSTRFPRSSFKRSPTALCHTPSCTHRVPKISIRFSFSFCNKSSNVFDPRVRGVQNFYSLLGA